VTWRRRTKAALRLHGGHDACRRHVRPPLLFLPRWPRPHLPPRQGSNSGGQVSAGGRDRTRGKGRAENGRDEIDRTQCAIAQPDKQLRARSSPSSWDTRAWASGRDSQGSEETQLTTAKKKKTTYYLATYQYHQKHLSSIGAAGKGLPTHMKQTRSTAGTAQGLAHGRLGLDFCNRGSHSSTSSPLAGDDRTS